MTDLGPTMRERLSATLPDGAPILTPLCWRPGTCLVCGCPSSHTGRATFLDDRDQDALTAGLCHRPGCAELARALARVWADDAEHRRTVLRPAAA